jgi:prophage antirepressor-like protein
MTNLIPFQFDTATVRVITTESGEILFVASDVAKALGYNEPHKAVSAHCKKSKSLINIDGINRPVQQNQPLANLDQKTKLIPESDVYRLVMRSKLEQAEEFQDWVCDEVLPSIRKHGGYIAQNTEFSELQNLLNSSFANPLPLAEVEKLRANVLSRVDGMIKKIPLVCTLEEWEKVKKRKFFKTESQTSLPFANDLELDGMPLEKQFEIILESFLNHKTAEGSSDESIRVLRSQYRAEFKKTGKINPSLLGQETRGRKTTLSAEIQQRFIELVKNSADKNNPDYLPVADRKISYFHTMLEDEFKQVISIHKLYTFASYHNLKFYLNGLAEGGV